MLSFRKLKNLVRAPHDQRDVQNGGAELPQGEEEGDNDLFLWQELGCGCYWGVVGRPGRWAAGLVGGDFKHDLWV